MNSRGKQHHCVCGCCKCIEGIKELIITEGKYWKSSPMSLITNLSPRSMLSSSIQLRLLAHSVDIYIGFQSLPSLGTPVWLIRQTNSSSRTFAGEVALDKQVSLRCKLSLSKQEYIKVHWTHEEYNEGQRYCTKTTTLTNITCKSFSLNTPTI